MKSTRQSGKPFLVEQLELRTLLSVECLGASHCSVTGHAEIDVNINVPNLGLVEIERYSFSAVRHKDGRVTGEWQVIDVTSGKNELIHGDVTCFRVAPDGKTVFMGGVIERENILGLPAGSEANWTVEDNGQGKKADPDRVTDLTFGFAPGSGRAARHCATGRGFTNLPLTPINKGNINVNVKSLFVGAPGGHDHQSDPSSSVLLPDTQVTKTVSVSGASDQQYARVQDAIDQINQAVGTQAFVLSQDSAKADILISHNDSSGCGSHADGVIGCSTTGGEITIIDGWNFHLSDDPLSIGSTQFDYQSVVAHELGHTIGLNHDDPSLPFMASTIAPGVSYLDNSSLVLIDSITNILGSGTIQILTEAEEKSHDIIELTTQEPVHSEDTVNLASSDPSPNRSQGAITIEFDTTPQYTPESQDTGFDALDVALLIELGLASR